LPVSIGSRKQPQTLAMNIFAALRHFDLLHVDLILAEGFDEDGVGQAVMNRLRKAAGGNIVYVE